MRGRKNIRRSGFTLIELMIVISLIATIAAIALPKLLSSRVNANETGAIATLKAIASAQASLQAVGSVDSDADGWGEFGYFAELSGSQPCRIAAGGAPAPGVAGVDELTPAVLSPVFGAVNGNGHVLKSGYIFQMWLPGTPAGGVTPGIAEDAAPGGKAAAPFPNPASGAVLWGCYAWPQDVGQTGNRAFFINEQGDVLQTLNRGPGAYDGPATTPGFDAAYSVAGDMASPIGVNGVPAVDGNVWMVVQ